MRHWALGLALLGATLPSSAKAVVLVHSNDVLGDIEPCGCRTNPLGGMARKANLLKKSSDPSFVQLDAGDLLFSSDTLPEMLRPQSELQAGYLLKAMDLLGHDAFTPGEKDFALGLKTFQKLVKKAKLKVIAANLVSRGGAKLFAPHVILTRKQEGGKTLRIGVIGIAGEKAGYPRELKVRPAIAAAKREVAALKGKVDLVVLLTHQGYEADQAMAKAVQGVDLIVGGHTQSFLQDPVRAGKAMIYQSSFRNQYVGMIPLARPFDGKGYRLPALDAGYDSPADAPSPPGSMDKLVEEFKKALGELNAREDAKLAAEVPVSASGEKFHTFPKCAECHLKQFDFWRKTRHARALSPLMEKRQYQNKECLSCHTVGLGDPQGFSSVLKLASTSDGPIETDNLARYLKDMHEADSLKAKIKLMPDSEAQPLHQSLGALKTAWTPVQCENCHQPGRDHPFAGSYSKTVEKTLCLNCHTAERAPEWYDAQSKPDWIKIDAKRASITCPAGDLPEPLE